MRTRIGILLVSIFLLGCGSNAPEAGSEALEVPAEETGEAPFLSTVHMADPRGANQLVEGFYGLEQGVWRWTQKEFVVLLLPPSLALGQPTYLEFKFTLPEALIGRLGPVTVSASVNETDLGGETFPKPGDFTFSKEIPSGVLGEEAASVKVSLDKAIPAGDLDERELGLVAVSIALK